MAKVSIIIPIYNGEKYLQECLNSVLGQTMEDIEIICVDDGSTDGTADLLEVYQRGDDRIIVIHQENQGVTAARGTGLKHASGEYVGFVDCDDWIDFDMYENLYECAIENQADFVTSGYVMEGAYITRHLDGVMQGVYYADEMENLRNNTIYHMAIRDVGLRATLGSKLFEREFIRKVHSFLPGDLLYSEDKMCVLTSVLEAKKVFVLHEAYYHYRQHSNSTVHVARNDYLSCVELVYDYLNRMYSHKNFTETMRIQAELYITEMLFKGINTRMGFQHRNLLWIDPDWIKKLPLNARVVLYGGGELALKYRTHIAARKDLIYVGCVDNEYESHAEQNFLEVFSIHELDKWVYDYIVITMKNKTKAEKVKEILSEKGISSDKIIWYEQKELFWKYAEADGLLH